jgi:hypothetical protein
MKELAYTEKDGAKRPVWIPAVRLNRYTDIPEGCEAIGLCGYAYTQAVVREGTLDCIGWTTVES